MKCSSALSELPTGTGHWEMMLLGTGTLEGPWHNLLTETELKELGQARQTHPALKEPCVIGGCEIGAAAAGAAQPLPGKQPDLSPA